MTGEELILGIDFGGTKVAIGLADRAGSLLVTRRLDTDAQAGAEQVVSRALAAARKLLADEGAADRLVAIGVVSPGIVLEDRILLAPNVPGWEELRLRELVAAEFEGVPIEVGTDAKAAALAEWRWGALADTDPAVFLSLGTGIAAAVLVGGRLLTGANGAAGEIGYNLLSPQDTDGFAGGAAPLEEAVGGRGLGGRASVLLGRPVTAGELFGLARENAQAKELVGAALDELSMHVANLAIALDPQRIAVGGGLVRSADILLPALRERLAGAVPFPPELVSAKFDQDASLLGAIAIALDA
ncbi:ROK family protein [Amycolatopsis keratiniphila]|uniref:Glucokinase n=1 Tax=Amycolatopsis keratiniphila subsp. keratiniphila TaxID=227715 RepID=A0A1W2LH05_9PSEU|nr:ROK family protein [Amycolatopsis keratiniphila]OLZ51227.1 glucokinase [Amycolatopsis keratiniphila subsp. nogabecina]ONF61902.1 glucokinase [Amycolatopsis keratiniphila subsp. keratiniphila]SDU29911.1 glucokinase [Amycolatopsis keratiniphila]